MLVHVSLMCILLHLIRDALGMLQYILPTLAYIYIQLAGIVKPNDGLCHLEVGANGRLEYTFGLKQVHTCTHTVAKKSS